MFLTDDELIELTGKVQRRKQIYFRARELVTFSQVPRLKGVSS